MNPTDGLQVAIFIAVPVLQVAIGGYIIRRRLIRTFPLFFAYIAYHVVIGLASTAAFYTSYSAYFWIFWINEGVDALLILAVIQEVFTVVLSPYVSLQRLGIVTFRSLTIALCVIASLTAILSPANELIPTMRALFVMDRSVQIVQLGLLLFLFVFCWLFGMTWRHYVFGIAAGFFVMTAISTSVLAVRSYEGQGGNRWANIFGPLGFAIGNAMWMCYFASEKSLVPLNIVLRTDQLIVWNQAL